MQLDITMSGRQLLSQRMQLSIKLLQMSATELVPFLEGCALENPVIEVQPPQEGALPGAHTDWGSRWTGLNPELPAQGANPLYQELLQQLSGSFVPRETARLVAFLIELLDENGYFTLSRTQILREYSLRPQQLCRALAVLQRMDPPGVGAFTLEECLLLQLARAPQSSPILPALIVGHLGALAQNQPAKLAKELGCCVEEIHAARAQLLTLNPKPGNGFASSRAIEYVRPEVLVVLGEEGTEVGLSQEHSVGIQIHSEYKALLRHADLDTVRYLQEKLRSAHWLERCLAQRRGTILRCASSIAARQSDFFYNGPGHRVPMTLSDVAEEVGLHPSSVSRAVQGKYLQCRWGVFELASFFTRTVSRPPGWGEGATPPPSQDMVCRAIQRIIQTERASAPYSDGEIAAQLQQYQIHIARRTVAKYRQQLGIAPASGRK